MNLADLQIIRPIPEGRSAVATVAARFGRLALIYIGIALVGVTATFVLALIGPEQTVIGVLGAIIGVSVILGIIHTVRMSVRMLRSTVGLLADSELAVLRKIAELATWRLGGGEHARFEHEVPDASEIRERVPHPEGAKSTPDLEFHTETVSHRRRWWPETAWPTVFLVIFCSLQIIHVLNYIQELLPHLSTFAAGLGTGVTFGVVFAIVVGALKLFMRKFVK